jgi:hypothetical protein
MLRSMNTRTKEERGIAAVTKRLVVNCVRNTILEHFHAGHGPITKTKDGSDIKIIDAEGKEYAWNEVSRITDTEMKEFIKQVVDRTYTFLTFIEDEEFQELMDRYYVSVSKWDAPQIDEGMLGQKLTERLCKKSKCSEENINS